jgi:hypothetical protein
MKCQFAGHEMLKFAGHEMLKSQVMDTSICRLGRATLSPLAWIAAT